MATALEILETIRDNASTDFIERVPSVTLTGLNQVGDAITADTNIMNEFITSLVNKIAFSNIKSKMYKNPLEKLKSAGVPYGSAIEEIFINPATDVGYQKDGTYLLKTTTPDGKTAYYGQNRKGCYPLSISEAQLKQAFRSEQDFMSLYNSIISALYSGDNIDEFTMMKKMLALAIDNDAMLCIDTDILQPKELSKAISNMSKMFTFANNQFCGYNRVNSAAIIAGDTPCITFCSTDRQVLLVRADAQTEIDYEVLATMFHMEVAKLEAMTILVDDIPSETKDIYALLVDRDAIQVRDSVFRTEVEFIKSNLTWNLWLHHWEFLFLSMFGNAVAFGKTK